MRTLSITWTEQRLHVLAELQQRPLLRRLLAFAEQRDAEVYAVGGALRDLCLGRSAQDVDLAMTGDVMGFAKAFANQQGAAYVPMDAERGEARVVFRKRHSLDFARLKGGTIIEDLRHRDFTIDAMACPLAALLTDVMPGLIDPHDGWQDLQGRVVRMVSPTSLHADPLRLLRAFRLAATLDFAIDAATLAAMGPVIPSLAGIAAERIHSELLKLFAAPRSSPHVTTMADLGLLDVLFPELAALRGITIGRQARQDLFAHSIEAYQAVENLINAPHSHLPAIADAVVEYLHGEERLPLVKWAALLHAIREPVVERGAAQVYKTAPRVAEPGARQWEQIGSRLKLSRKQTDYIDALIAHHGQTLELASFEAQGDLTLRVVHDWCKEVGNDMLGVFVLAVGHLLAAGQEGPSGHEVISLGRCAAHIWELYLRRILPVIRGPRLVTGHDLQRLFNLTPGPRFKSLLDELEALQVEGRIQTRAEALQWVEEQLRQS